MQAYEITLFIFYTKSLALITIFTTIINNNNFVELKINFIKMGTPNRTDDILHGVTLAMILDYLVEEYGFEELSELVRINCFKSNPSKQSSLKFLRKTEWARNQVQGLYVRTVLEKKNR